MASGPSPKDYYSHATPIDSCYNFLTDEGRQSVASIMSQTQRESYVHRGTQWSLKDLERHRNLIKTALENKPISMREQHSNSLSNLNKAIEHFGTPEGQARLRAHLYENYDRA